MHYCSACSDNQWHYYCYYPSKGISDTQYIGFCHYSCFGSNRFSFHLIRLFIENEQCSTVLFYCFCWYHCCCNWEQRKTAFNRWVWNFSLHWTEQCNKRNEKLNKKTIEVIRNRCARNRIKNKNQLERLSLIYHFIHISLHFLRSLTASASPQILWQFSFVYKIRVDFRIFWTYSWFCCFLCTESSSLK